MNPAADQDSNRSEADIRSLVASMMESWNKGDAAAFAKQFAADGTFTNVIGAFYQGRADFQERHHAIFTTIYKDSSVKMTIAKLRFVRPDVAIADIDTELTNVHSLPPGFVMPEDKIARSKLLIVFSRDKNAWWIEAFHNVGVAPPPAQ